MRSSAGQFGIELAKSIVNSNSLAVALFIFSLTTFREFRTVSLCKFCSISVGKILVARDDSVVAIILLNLSAPEVSSSFASVNRDSKAFSRSASAS